MAASQRSSRDDSKQAEDAELQPPPRMSASVRSSRGHSSERRGGSSVATFNLTLAERAQLATTSRTYDSEKAQQIQPTGQPPQQRRRPQPHQPRTASASSCLPSSSSSSTLSAHMTGRLHSNSYECCICNELITASQPVWSCAVCYVLLHHRCVERWWNVKRVAQGTLGGEVSWPCAGCLSMQAGSVREYRCFCGKIADPDVNPYITPHSCGQPCGKRRTAVTGAHACPHRCAQPCHPGPCSPCTVMLTRPCGCGRGSYQIRCGTSDPTAETCGSMCEKQLSCGHHHCQRLCHFGPCDSCSVVVKQTCWCEKEQTERLCGSEAGTDERNRPRYSCLHSCNHLLDCGHHSCCQLCHPLAHPRCSRLPSSPQPCACGKSTTDVGRADCRDPLPTCGARCGHPLRCGQHHCDQRCHDGDCAECSAVSHQSCRCGNETIAMPCKVVLEAEQRKQRTVSEHLADGLEPPAEDELEQLFVCDRPCNVRLSCGQHKCPNRCCPPSSSHLCMRLCDKPLTCGQHRCDEHCHGQTPCPPCSIVIRQPLSCHCGNTTLPANQPCGTSLKCPYPCTRIRACGHSCAMLCHEETCDTIAPCAVLTERMCGGGHRVMRNIPCYATSASCGVTCRKLLTCGQHICLRPCHAGPCKEEAAADVVASCGQKCSKVRVNCIHACKASCHPGLPCPDVLCEEAVVVKCDCGRKNRSGRCNSSDVHADDSLSVPCDEQCEVEQRNARLRDILSVQASRPILPYPTMVMQAVLDRQLLDFCVRSERKLNDWLDEARQPTKNFPSMKSDQRWLLHQLAAHYQLTAESVDQAPNRSVRFIRQPHSAIPSVSLSSATRSYVNGKTAKVGSGGPTGVDEMHLLHFMGLTVTPQLSMSDVRMMMHDWEAKYRLNWLDDDHAIAMFDERSMRDRARERLLARGMWRDDRGDRSGGSGTDVNGKLAADSVCLFRKVAVNESGQLQGVSRDRDKKRLVTGHDGFTAVVTVRRGGAAGPSGGLTKLVAATPDSSSSSSSSAASASDTAPPRRPLVSLTGLKSLQRQHAADTSASHAPSSPSTSPPITRPVPQASHDIRSRESDTEQHSSGDEHSHSQPLAALSAVPVAASSFRFHTAPAHSATHSVVGLYTPPVEQVRRDNRWAPLMDDEEEQQEAQWEAARQKRAGRKQRQENKRTQQVAVGLPAGDEAESEEGWTAAQAEINDWEQAAGQPTGGARRNRASVSGVEDHSAW